MILVTGGTGLLGSHLLLKLAERGHQIRALKRQDSDIGAIARLFAFYKTPVETETLLSQIQWVNGDLSDPDSLEQAMEGCDKIFHCAAMVSFHRKDKNALFSVNTEGTANLVNAALKAGVRRFNHVSSVAALGRSTEQKTIDENTRWKNAPENSNYAVSKFLAENEVWRGAEEGLEVCIVNPGIIIGPGDASRSSTALFGTVWRGLPRTAPGSTGMVGASDAAEAMIALDEASIGYQKFVLVSDNKRFHDLATEIAMEMGAKNPGRPAPRWMFRLAWIVLGLISFLTRKKAAVTRETLRAAYSDSYYDGSKITRSITFHYSPLSKSIAAGAKFFHLRGKS